MSAAQASRSVEEVWAHAAMAEEDKKLAQGNWRETIRASNEDPIPRDISAYLHIPLFTRIMALFMLPQEMHVRSGGFRAVIPRNMARKAVNELLAQVGAPPIP